MNLPSPIGRERMTLLSLLTGIKMKDNNIPTIQAWESMDFPWDVPRDIPQKIHTLPRLDGRYVIFFRASESKW